MAVVSKTSKLKDGENATVVFNWMRGILKEKKKGKKTTTRKEQ